MDVCETGGELYIVECNCMNAAGFYDANIEAALHPLGEQLPDQLFQLFQPLFQFRQVAAQGLAA